MRVVLWFILVLGVFFTTQGRAEVGKRIGNLDVPAEKLPPEISQADDSTLGVYPESLLSPQNKEYIERDLHNINEDLHYRYTRPWLFGLTLGVAASNLNNLVPARLSVDSAYTNQLNSVSQLGLEVGFRLWFNRFMGVETSATILGSGLNMFGHRSSDGTGSSLGESNGTSTCTDTLSVNCDRSDGPLKRGTTFTMYNIPNIDLVLNLPFQWLNFQAMGGVSYNSASLEVSSYTAGTPTGPFNLVTYTLKNAYASGSAWNLRAGGRIEIFFHSFFAISVGYVYSMVDITLSGAKMTPAGGANGTNLLSTTGTESIRLKSQASTITVSITSYY